jgi:hypothetical protein
MDDFPTRVPALRSSTNPIVVFYNQTPSRKLAVGAELDPPGVFGKEYASEKSKDR